MAVFNVWILMRLSEKGDCRVEHRDFQPKLGLFLTQQQLKQRLESKQKLSLKLQITEMRGVECAGNLFILSVNKENKNCFTLKELVNKFKSLPGSGERGFYFCFADNSEYVETSWVMRVYVAFLFYKW
ncbi:hypothetical protein GQX74_009521 [Glossina fuscipes]|nr:hypothetical protein GQX74_009521 [Glossina fuscipes]